MVADEQITTRLRQLLGEVDIQTTTERQLRKTLEAEFGEDLSGRKAVIRGEVEQYLAEQSAKVEEDANEEAAEADEDPCAVNGDGKEHEDGGADTSCALRRRGKRSGFGSRLSPEMAQFLGVDSMSRTEVVKRLWEYIKAHDLQNPKDKRKIVLDEQLGTLFKPPLNMLNMNKQLSRHVYVEDREDGSNDEGEERAPKLKRRPAANGEAAKAKKARRESEGGVAKPTGFTREHVVSPELAAWLDRKTVSRPDLTRFFWAYIKERGLQNPANKQEVLADDALAALTGERRFKAFGFMKLFSKHILEAA